MNPLFPIDGRFVLLAHTMPVSSKRGSHWDLMLEHGPKLLTFELTTIPPIGGFVDSKRLNDHRLEFLDFEGELTRDRGVVKQMANGRFESNPSDGSLLIRLVGNRFSALLDFRAFAMQIPTVGDSIEIYFLEWQKS